MTTIAVLTLYILVIGSISAAIAYAIMRWSFSPKRHMKLAARYDGMPIAGLNSGAIILLSLGLAFIFSDISAVHTRAKNSTFQEADAIRALGRMAVHIDPTVGVPLIKSAQQYTTDVLEKEWPALKQGSSSAIRSGASSALASLTVMADLVYSPEHIVKLPTVTGTQLANLVTRIGEQRLQRIEASNFGMGLRGYVLVAITLIATSILLSMATLVKPATQFISNFFLFFITILATYLAFDSQNPFFGLDVVTNMPLREALDRLNATAMTLGR